MIWKPPNSRFLWIKYYRDGECFRESTHGTSRGRAEKLLRTRLAEIDAGTFGGPQVRRVGVLELYQAFLDNYRIMGKRALKWAETNWDRHLEPHFGKLKAAQVTTDVLTAYIAKRQAEKAQNGTVNRELACLRRAFNLAYRATPPKVRFVPRFEHLAENAPRQGFVVDAQYQQLIAANPPLWLRAMLALAYNFGFRKGELLTMTAGQVDLLGYTIRLYRGTTKSGEPRLVSFAGLTDVEALLRECVSGKQPGDPLFTRPNGGRVANPANAWRTLCVKAGLGEYLCPHCRKPVGLDQHCAACNRKWQLVELRYNGLLLHDLRRSAVRNLLRAGVSEQIVMTISGHKSRSTFMRYNIISDTDLREAAHKLAQARSDYAQVGQSTGIDEVDTKARKSQVV